MFIEWNGHSCFTLTANNYSIVIDPYNPQMFPNKKPNRLSANLIVASHGHDDHNYKEAVDIHISSIDNPFSLETIETFHDDVQGAKRGKNNITIFAYNSIRVAHFGDLGCFLKKEEYAKLQNLDAIMIPVGGYYTIDANIAKQIIDIIHPKVIIPMHYRGENFGFPVLATIDDFLKLFDSKEVHFYHTNQIEISRTTSPQVAVLEYS